MRHLRYAFNASACSALLATAASAQLSSPVMLPGDLDIEPSAEVQSVSSIARGGNQYLVVWQDARTELTGTVESGGWYAPGPVDIFAARLDAAGNPIDTTPIVVGMAPFEQRRPEVAWNGTDWLVIWESRRIQQYTTTVGMRAARVSAAGKLLDDPPIVIDDDDSVDEWFATVASDGNGWMVAWEDYDPSSSSMTINSALIDASGSVTSKKTLNATTSGFYQPHHLDLCFAQDRYLLTMEHSQPGGPSGITARLFDVNLNEIGSEFQISSTGGKPEVATDGSGFYVAWTWGSSWKYTRGTPVAIDGSVGIPGGATLVSYGQVGDTEPCVAWDGMQWVMTIERWGTNTDLEAYRIDSAGQVIGAPSVVATHSGIIAESIVASGAGAPGESVVVWTDGWVEYSDMLVTALDANAGHGPITTLTTSARAQILPDLAGDAQNGYLLVYVSRSSGMARVFGHRLDGQGQPLDPEPTLILWSDERTTRPRLAWNGGEWLVVWADTFAQRIFGRRVASDGTVLDPISIDIMAGDQPDVAANGSEFLVVSSVKTSHDTRSIYSMRVGANGTLLDPSMQWVGYDYATNPRVEAIGGRWLATWQRNPTHDSPYSSILAAFIEASGVPQAVFSVESAPTSTQRAPDLAVAGSMATIGWSDGSDVRIRRIDAAGVLQGSAEGIVVSNAANDQFGVKVGSNGVDSFVAWVDYRIHPVLEAGVGDVYGARVDASGHVLDPAGLAIGADPKLPEANPAIAGGSGLTIAAYVAFDPTPGLGAYRISIRTLGDPGVGTAFCFGSSGACPCGNGAGADEGCANSSGQGGRLDAGGSTSVAANDLTLHASGLPPSVVALLFHGTGTVAGGATPFGDGLLCLAGGIQRYGTVVSGSTGSAQFGPGLAAQGLWAAGQQLNFQTWYRDPVGSPCGQLFNLSSALAVTLTP